MASALALETVAQCAVLGIDAAWTETQPSGVAVAAKFDGGWKLLAVAPSYDEFLATVDRSLQPPVKPSGSPIDAKALLAIASSRAGRKVDLVAVDMPLAHTPIDKRRVSDDAVSRFYGAKWCSTHSPSAKRPGPVGETLKRAFAEEGYLLATQAVTTPALIEVYPHPALVELANADKRLPYKVQRVRSYWPDLTGDERRRALLKVWDGIVTLLDAKIAGTREHLLEDGQLLACMCLDRDNRT